MIEFDSRVGWLFMSNASFWVCTDFWVNELGAGWTGGPAGLSVFPSRAFPWRSGQNGRDKSSKFLFPRRCLSSVALARQHRLRSCSSPRIGARFNVVLQLLDRVILWRFGVKPIRSGLAFVLRTELGIVRRLGAIRCIFAYDLFEMSCTRLSTKRKTKTVQ